MKLTDKLWIKYRVGRLVSDFGAPSSIQGDQSKLGGPENSLSERSPGVGREEQPPIAVVVQSLSRFCHLTILFNKCE